MRRTLPESLLSRLSEFLAARIGLHFPAERRSDLERGVSAAARDFGLPDAEACARWLLSAPLTQGQIEVLASHLTVGETYFFREQRTFDALEQHILPDLLRARRGGEQRLRIWSAGCCTGEEPYSVAMVLDKLIPDPEAWSVTLLATDINPRFLRKAAEGAYGKWSFRDAPAAVLDRYFSKRGDGRFELHRRVRKKVTFSYLNLADDAYPSLLNNTSAMDLILCRNVLMYFAAERAKRVVENLYRSLVDGGWLIVSPTEASNVLFASFSAVEFPGAVLYRKTASAEPKAEPSAPLIEMPRAPETPAAPEAGAAPSRAPEDAQALAAAARRCADEGRLAEAAERCEKAIAGDKLNPSHRYLLATIRQEQKQPAAAAQALRRALYLDPGFVLAHFALANLRLSQGRRREAERHFANALALLRARPRDEALPESDGLTAGRLIEIIASVRASQPRAAARA